MKTSIIAGSILLLLLAGCSSSQITNSWVSPGIPAKKYTKVMVIGLFPDNNRDMREKMENHFVSDLIERGINTVSSYQEYGPKSFEALKEEDALAKLQHSGVDAVITIVLLNKEKEKYYVPGRVTYSPYTIYQRRFYGYYTTIYDRIYEPGYYSERTNLFWESNFYDVESKTLLYSVQTKSFDPGSTESLAHEYGKMIVSDMGKKGLLNK